MDGFKVMIFEWDAEALVTLHCTRQVHDETDITIFANLKDTNEVEAFGE